MTFKQKKNYLIIIRIHSAKDRQLVLFGFVVCIDIIKLHIQ